MYKMRKESCKEEWSCKAQQTVPSLPIDGFPGRTCSRPNVLGTQSNLYQIFLLTPPAHTISSHIFSNIFLWFNYFNHFLMSWELNQTCIKYFLRHNPPTQYLVILSNVFLVSDFLCPGDFIKHIVLLTSPTPTVSLLIKYLKISITLARPNRDHKNLFQTGRSGKCTYGSQDCSFELWPV